MTKNLPWWCIGVIAAFFLPSFPHYGYYLIYGAPLLSGVPAYFKPRWRPYFFLFLGLAYAIFRIDAALVRQLAGGEILKTVPVTVKVLSTEKITPLYHEFRGQLVNTPGNLAPLLLRDYHGRPWPLGSVWQGTANLRPAVGRDSISGFSAEARALAAGIGGRGTLGADRRRLNLPLSFTDRLKIKWAKVPAAVQAKITRAGAGYSAGAALITALTLGSTAGFTAAARDDFQSLGLNHLVSISGLHMGIIYLLVGLLLISLIKVIIRLGGRRWLPETPLLWLVGISWLAALLYGLLAGLSLPTQRSLLMLGAVSYTLISRRYYSPWRIWWTALTAVLLFNPFGVLTIGFWLSFLLVAALLLLPPPLGGGTSYRERAQTFIINLLRVQYTATLASLPLLAVFFFTFPLYGFIANLLLIPWFTLVLTQLALLGVLLPGTWLLTAAVFLGEKTLAAVHFCTAYITVLSLPQLPLGWLLLLIIAVVILILPRGLGLKCWALLVLAAVFVYTPSRPEVNEFTVVMPDVGQGLAVLFITKHHQLLFDTGDIGVGNEVAATVAARGIKHLDLLVLSHHDRDHDGNWQQITKNFQVKNIAAGQKQAYVPLPGSRVVYCQNGLNWDWDGVHFEFLTPFTPAGGATENKKNRTSCVLRVVAAAKALLITGDLDQAGEAALVGAWGDNLAADVLVAGHHGSVTATGDGFLAAVAPAYVLISAGYLNSFGHPHPAVLQRLAFFRIPYWRTDLQGGAVVTFGEKITVKALKSYHPFWQKKPFGRR